MVELSGKSNEGAPALANFQTALRVPMGAVSPLWFIYAGAASAGVAYWWMARWSKPQNLEALFSAKPGADVVIEAAERVVEVIEAVEEAAAEAIAQISEIDAEADTVALEAAIFSPPPPELEAASETPIETEVAAEAASSEPFADPAPEAASLEAAAEPSITEPVIGDAPIAAEKTRPATPKKPRAKSAASPSAESE